MKCNKATFRWLTTSTFHNAPKFLDNPRICLNQTDNFISCIMTKHAHRASDQALHKQDCAASAHGSKLNIEDKLSRGL